jgi:hypothetical protein
MLFIIDLPELNAPADGAAAPRDDRDENGGIP